MLSAELATVRPAATTSHAGPDADPDAGLVAGSDEPAGSAQYEAAPSVPQRLGSGGWEWGEHTRVRPALGLVAEPASVAPQPPASVAPTSVVPAPAARHDELAPISVPGRHAARRGATSLVPEGLRGRVALHPAHLSVVAVAVALALGWCCWWLVRGQTEPVLTPVVSVDPLASTPQGPAGGPTEGTAAGTEAGTEGSPVPGSEEGAAQPAAERDPATATVTVDVAGKVRRPGIAVLPAGSRVVDALESAGGARPGVDLTGLNLARLLVDGEQVLVGMPSVPGGPPVTPPATAGATGGPAALVNINTADQTTLETLPGVGPVTAGAIIGWRSENGGFSSVTELLEVDGIGEVTLDQLSPLVTL